MKFALCDFYITLYSTRIFKIATRNKQFSKSGNLTKSFCGHKLLRMTNIEIFCKHEYSRKRKKIVKPQNLLSAKVSSFNTHVNL